MVSAFKTPLKLPLQCPWEPQRQARKGQGADRPRVLVCTKVPSGGTQSSGPVLGPGLAWGPQWALASLRPAEVCLAPERCTVTRVLWDSLPGRLTLLRMTSVQLTVKFVGTYVLLFFSPSSLLRFSDLLQLPVFAVPPSTLTCIQAAVCSPGGRWGAGLHARAGRSRSLTLQTESG